MLASGPQAGKRAQALFPARFSEAYSWQSQFPKRQVQL